MFALSKSIDDKCEADEDDEHDVQFVDPGEDPTKAVELPEQTFNLVTALVHTRSYSHQVVAGFWVDFIRSRGN